MSAFAVDEMVDGSGRLRAHWRGLMAAVAELGNDSLAERTRLLDRAFVDQGITTLLPGASPAPWRCDPIPLLIRAGEFAALEAALAQRAELLEALLADLYGPQLVLAEGLIPPALIYRNPGFLRACRVAEDQPAARRLHCYAADLIRAQDGAWRVVADRTGIINGVAYALENRAMMARVFPEFLRIAELGQLRPFLEAWRDSLQALAPARPNPAVALLTPGHSDPVWFEHVALARHLSCALVEPGDLTARDGLLHLKTLHGLQRVDVLLRKLDDRALDPLELAPDSVTGVPGMLDTLRGGGVRMVNAPGAALLEAPALAAFLPAVARALLGEDLRIDGPETVWLGDAGARRHVLANLHTWTIRPALDGGGAALAPARLPDAAHERLANDIAADPARFCATAAISPSVTPSAGPSGLVPRPVQIRVFLIHDGQGWRAMQGGLARVLGDDDICGGRLPARGVSKDICVVLEERVPVIGAAAQALPALAIRRTSGDLPSRAADNFFWLGRYLERLEHAARLQRAVLARLTRVALSPRDMSDLAILASCLVRTGLVSEELVAGETTGALRAALMRAAQADGWFPVQLRLVAALTESLRDRLSADMHGTCTRALADMDEALRQARHQGASRALERLTGLSAAAIGFAASVAGLAAENMVRGGGRLFLDLGRRVERAHDIAADIADALEPPSGMAPQPGRVEDALRLVLDLCDSGITYRSRYLTVVQPAPALDLVLADEGNPRALAFQLAAARALLMEIAGEQEPALAGPCAALLRATQALMAEMAGVTPAAQVAATALLPARLHGIAEGVSALSDRITRQYFAVLPAVRSLGVNEAARRGAAA